MIPPCFIPADHKRDPEVAIDRNKRFSVRQLEELVGGPYKLVPQYRPGEVIVCRADGTSPQNARATRQANISAGRWVYGPAVWLFRDQLPESRL